MSSFVFAGAFCVSLIGAVVQSVCGFGYGPLNMSLLPYLMPYPQAVALAGLCGTTTAVMVAVSGWRHANWRKVWPCTVTSVILSGLFVWLSTRAADTLMLHLLGCVLIALGLYSLFFNGKIRIRPTVRNGIIAGAISGVT
ncbi:MAG: sulfite exporter TauE/SafE family protein, partial [Pyramidobacter sp.]|nr:sulfite exporter TauE/SafE family protein [Pyramidobacter sp.]